MPPTTPASTESRILWRTDVHLLPFLATLFLLNSLDRTNLGSAETGNFTQHAGLQPSDLSDAISLFFLFFVVLQPFGAALGKSLGPPLYLCLVMSAWGLLTALNAFVSARWQLLLLRAMIGCLEAGFYPTTVYYLGTFYTRYEFAKRLGVFYGQYAVAGAVGSGIAAAVFKIFPEDGGEGGGWKAYQVLFVLEGGLTMMVAAWAYYYLPREVSHAWWVSKDEALWLAERAAADRRPSRLPSSSDSSPLLNPSTDSDAALTLSHRRKPYLLTTELAMTKTLSLALTDPFLYFLLALNILSALAPTSLSIFLPLLLSSSHSPTLSNLLSIPPFLCGFLTLLVFAHYSDSSRRRFPFILSSLVITFVGLLVLLGTTSYVALCLMIAGAFVTSPLMVAWLSGNVEDEALRAVVLGVNGWGNLAGVLTGIVFRKDADGKGYVGGLWWTMAATVLAGCGYAAVWQWVRRRRGRGKRREGWAEELGE